MSKKTAGTALKPVRVGAILALVVAGLLAIVYWTAPEQTGRVVAVVTPQFDVMRVQPADISLSLHSQGVAEPRSSIILAFRTEGEVTQVSPSFEDGGWVEAGDPLVWLEQQPLELALGQRRHELASARLHLERTRANAHMARRDVSSKSTAYARNEPQLQEAEARLEAARQAVTQAEADLERAVMTAPFSGRLKGVSVSQGEWVTPGQALGQLYSARAMEVRLPVRDDWLALLDERSGILGASTEALDIQVALSGRFAGEQRVWRGVITRREGGISRNQMSWLIAEVAADSSPVLLEPGVFVEAEIEGRQLKEAVALPRSALQKDQTVWLVDESGKLRQRTIEPVHSDRQHIYLTRGLDAGERVLLRGSEMLGEGMQVDVREVDVQPVSRPRPVVSQMDLGL